MFLFRKFLFIVAMNIVILDRLLCRDFEIVECLILKGLYIFFFCFKGLVIIVEDGVERV